MARRKTVQVAGASVVAPDAPTVTAPSASAVIYNGVATTLTATVTAGQVPDSIQFLLDDTTVIATDTSSPYSQSYTPSAVSSGTHTIKARYVYGSGTVTSAGVSVTVYSALLAEAVGRYVPTSLVDTSGKVSQWTNTGNAGSSAYDLIQGTAGNRMTYDATGNRSGGPAAVGVPASSTFIETAGTLAQPQPRTILFVAKLTSDVTARLWSGKAANTLTLFMSSGAGATYIYSGVQPGLAGFAINTWYTFAAVFDGTSSLIRRNASTSGVVNAGTTAETGGLTVGARGDVSSSFWDGPIEQGWIWPRALTSQEIDDVRTELGLP